MEAMMQRMLRSVTNEQAEFYVEKNPVEYIMEATHPTGCTAKISLVLAKALHPDDIWSLLVNKLQEIEAWYDNEDPEL